MSRISSLIVVTAIVLASVTAPIAHDGATGPTKARMDAMSDMGRALKQLALAARSGPAASDPALAAPIEVLLEKGQHLPMLFNEKDIPAISEALPKIWDEPDTFSKSIDAYDKAVENLKAAHGAKDDEAFASALREVSNTCKSCHQSFRE